MMNGWLGRLNSCTRACWALAAWFALGTALADFFARLGMQALGWAVWDPARAASLETAWMGVVSHVFLFGGAAGFLCLIGRLWPRMSLLRAAAVLYPLLALLGLLALSASLSRLAVVTLAAGLAAASGGWLSRRQEAFMRLVGATLAPMAVAVVLLLAGLHGGLWLRERLAITRLSAARPGAPNILLIVLDSVRADHLPCYGYRRPTSPRLDRLAANGLLFERAIATSSWSLPSHASLLVGRYPHEHGAEKGPLEAPLPTLAEVLRARGYRTAAFSANLYAFTRRVGLGRGFIRFEDYDASVVDWGARTVYGRAVGKILGAAGIDNLPGRKRAEDISRAALRWIARDRGRPFFAVLNYFDAHDTDLPPARYRTRFAGHTPRGLAADAFHHRKKSPEMSREQVREAIDLYDGAIAYIDEQVGMLIEGLGAAGLSGSTVVVVTSDHGESFGEHGLADHGNALYRQLIWVPLVVWAPGRVPANRRVSSPVSLAAVPATMLELAGLPPSPAFALPSLARLWRSPAPPGDAEPALAELAQWPQEPNLTEAEKRYPVYHGWMKPLVTERWHYIEHEKFGAELYDWDSDPAEMNNAARTPAGQQAARELAAQLRRLLRASVTPVARDSHRPAGERLLPGNPAR